ncbi:DNA gyrase inhibitor YacG [Tabrizicola sp. BL-A-41-H6]|uniref:DNA gyrase inhibitor YacG n=1 Tax=Tabrizicola sp. BL-A-41-H6 TaxID=3421107 RepID=UPI003D66B643
MTCPVCGKPTDLKVKPFCSRRCADVDLGRWLNESYRVAGEPVDLGSEDESEERPKPH